MGNNSGKFSVNKKSNVAGADKTAATTTGVAVDVTVESTMKENISPETAQVSPSEEGGALPHSANGDMNKPSEVPAEVTTTEAETAVNPSEVAVTTTATAEITTTETTAASSATEAAPSGTQLSKKQSKRNPFGWLKRNKSNKTSKEAEKQTAAAESTEQPEVKSETEKVEGEATAQEETAPATVTVEAIATTDPVVEAPSQEVASPPAATETEATVVTTSETVTSPSSEPQPAAAESVAE